MKTIPLEKFLPDYKKANDRDIPQILHQCAKVELYLDKDTIKSKISEFMDSFIYNPGSDIHGELAEYIIQYPEIIKKKET